MCTYMNARASSIDNVDDDEKNACAYYVSVYTRSRTRSSFTAIDARPRRKIPAHNPHSDAVTAIATSDTETRLRDCDTRSTVYVCVCCICICLFCVSACVKKITHALRPHKDNLHSTHSMCVSLKRSVSFDQL